MKKSCMAVLALTTLALPVIAQQSPLVIKTANPGLARMALSLTQTPDAQQMSLPEFGPLGHFLLTLDDGGVMQVQAGDGKVSMLEITAQPAALMEIYADGAAQAQQVAQGGGAALMTQLGLQARDGIKVIRALFDFPKQIDQLSVKISGDIGLPEEGFAARVAITPAAGSWFGHFVASLRPLPAGAPLISGPHALLWMVGSIDLQNSPEIWAPFLEVSSWMGSKSKEDTAGHLGYAKSALQAMDGSFAMTWESMGTGAQTVMGLRDPGIMTKLMADAGFREWSEQAMASNASADSKTDHDAFEHRGVTVSRAETSVDDPTGASPLLVDGLMTTFTAIAGSYALSNMHPGEDRIKELIDDALDQKIRRQPLPSNTLLVMKMRMAELIDSMAGGGIPLEGIPEILDVSLGTANGTLTIKVGIDR